MDWAQLQSDGGRVDYAIAQCLQCLSHLALARARCTASILHGWMDSSLSLTAVDCFAREEPVGFRGDPSEHE